MWLESLQWLLTTFKQASAENVSCNYRKLGTGDSWHHLETFNLQNSKNEV